MDRHTARHADGYKYKNVFFFVGKVTDSQSNHVPDVRFYLKDVFKYQNSNENPKSGIKILHGKNAYTLDRMYIKGK